MTSIGEGFFIPLSKKEADFLYSVTKDAGFSENGEGVKKLLFTLIEEVSELDDEEETLKPGLEDLISFVSQNPEIFENGKKAAKVAFNR